MDTVAKRPNGKYELELSDPVKEFLGLEFPNDWGGRSGHAGFRYQYLYALRLMGRILNKELSTYICEKAADFFAIKLDDEGRPVKFEVIEVKSRSRTISENDAIRAMRQLAHRAALLRSQYPDVVITCRLVLNRRPRGNAKVVQKLKALVPEVSWPPNCTGEIESFISPDLNFQETGDELKELIKIEPRLESFFLEPKNCQRFLEAILGMTIPFHSPRSVHSLSAWLENDGVRIGLPGQGADEVVATIRDCVDQVLRRVKQATVVKQSRIHDLRLTGFSLERKRAKWSSNPEYWELGDRDSAKRQLMLLAKVNKEGSDPAFVREVGRFRRGDRFALKFDLTGLDPLSAYRIRKRRSHRDRLALASSLVQAIARWAEAGIVLKRDFAEYHQNWYVKETERGSQFVCAGFHGVALFDDSNGFLSSRWIWTRPLADAFIKMYYLGEQPEEKGVTVVRDITGGTIADILTLLRKSEFIEASELHETIFASFESEQMWPIFISEIDPRFNRDVLNAGEFSSEEALCNAEPLAWQMDHGRGHAEIFYANCKSRDEKRVQVGLLEKNDGTFVAYRYFRYGGERWSDHRTIDHAWERPILKSSEDSATFVLLDRGAVPELISWQSFGVTMDEVKEWVKESRESLIQFSLRKKRMPPSIEQEEALHIIRRLQQDAFSRRRFSCKIATEGDQVRVETEFEHFLRHAEQCGYRRDDLDGLSLVAEDDENRFITGDIRLDAGEFGQSATIKLDEAHCSEQLPNKGAAFKVINRGTDAVIHAEQSIFNAFRFQPDGPARRAWEFINRMVGQNGPLQAAPEWTGIVRLVEECESSSEADIAQEILEAFSSPVSWQVINGAPGTGKTRLVADLAARYLERQKDRIFPPCRVLVVANTHWAIDNFFKVFALVNGKGHLVKRELSPRARARLRQDEGRRGFHDNLESEYSAEIRLHLPVITVDQIKHKRFEEQRSYLKKLLTHIQAMERRSPRIERPYLVSSQMDWRAKHRFPLLLLAHNLRAFANMVEEALRLMDEYTVSSEASPIKSRAAGEIGVDAFAAQIIGSTVDGLRRVPDMGFDLVIFEEASQLCITSMLKVLTQVIRGRTPRTNLHVLLSGDPKQLPPHMERDLPSIISQNRENELLIQSHQKALNAPSFFTRVCRRSSGRIRTLTVQRRMHPEIATLVNTLFYNDQTWQCPRRDKPRQGAVFWIDPVHFPGKRGKEGKSQFDTGEAEVVRRLYEGFRRHKGRFLAITPYRAQQRMLERELSGGSHTATVDSCQGIEADVVAVSLVGFGPFVMEAERLNVACSRARERLYLIGDFKQFCSKADRSREIHLRGLAELFSPSGFFADRLIEPTPSTWNSDGRLSPS